MDHWTIEELGKFDGKQGRSSYVAVNGEVYDVSTSRMWENRNHMGLHSAGEDLTDALNSAPHGEEVLRRVIAARATNLIRLHPRRHLGARSGTSF